jgi:DNA-binding MarR family transcriptional regulator
VTIRTPPVAAQPRIAYSVGRLERAVRRELSRVTRRFGLTVAQYTALSVLRARGEVSNAQLARRSFVSPQAMNELIQAMAGKALLAREPHERHGRIVTIRLTAKGGRVLAECDAEVERVEDAMLGRLSGAERAQLQALLRACIDALEARKLGDAARRRRASHGD